jgi:hypothetical protein
MKNYRLSENIIRNSIRKNLLVKESDEMSEKKQRCVPENVIPLDEIVGYADDYVEYAPGATKRKLGVNSMVDSLGILNNLRLFKGVEDGGTHLSYNLMHHLNKFRNKNYYDETTGNCSKAMDKIIELYKENEHGTELVKDIERVLALQSKDDEYTPSPRTKEYLKRCLALVKGE